MDLRKYLDDNGIRISHLAKVLKITASSLHNILNKKHSPTLKTAILIEDFTHRAVTVRDLLPEPNISKKHVRKSAHNKENNVHT